MRDYRLIDAIAFKLRALAMIPVAVFLGFCRWNEMENLTVAWGLGLLIFLGGVMLRVWAQRHLCYRLKAARRLAVTGPYAHVRNPVYIANALMLMGLALTCELLWALPLVGPWAALVYAFAVRFEETRLLKRYGEEYQQYRDRVPAWLPSLPAPTGLWPDCTGRASWAAAFGVEWHCALLLLLPVLKELMDS